MTEIRNSKHMDPVFRFQFFRFISLTSESLTPETSNSAIRNILFFGMICALNTSKSFPEITGNEHQNVGFKQGDPRSMSGVTRRHLCALCKGKSLR
jgi:hypothetical protein